MKHKNQSPPIEKPEGRKRSIVKLKRMGVKNKISTVLNKSKRKDIRSDQYDPREDDSLPNISGLPRSRNSQNSNPGGFQSAIIEKGLPKISKEDTIQTLTNRKVPNSKDILCRNIQNLRNVMNNSKY